MKARHLPKVVALALKAAERLTLTSGAAII